MSYQAGGAGPYPGDPSGLEWSVSITDDDQRSMTAAQIVQEYQRGGLDLQDTFVWREGMDDWVPLGQAAELVALMNQSAGAPAAAPYPYPQSAPAGEPYGSTVLLDAPAQQAPAPAEAPAFGAAPAARRAGGPAVDVFEAQAAAADGAARKAPPRRVGERNEASALFSLDAIRGGGPAPEPRKKQRASRVDDELMGLGLGAGGMSASLEPPPLNAPVLTPPPQPKLPPQIEAQLLAAAQYTPPPKSKAPIFIAAAVGVILFGAVTVFLVMRHGSEQPTAQNAATADTGKSDTSAGSTPTAETTTAAAETTTAAATASSSDSKTDAKAGSTAAAKGGSTSGSKTSDAKTSEPKTEPKEEPKPTAEPAGGGAEFNRDAASAAMGGAAGGASGCGKPDGPTGRCKVTVTFAPSGRATNVSVGPPCGGSPVGSCIAAAFRKISIPPFSGDPMSVSKTVTIK
jgi:hypothetical protein